MIHPDLYVNKKYGLIYIYIFNYIPIFTLPCKMSKNGNKAKYLKVSA